MACPYSGALFNRNKEPRTEIFSATGRFQNLKPNESALHGEHVLHDPTQ